MASRKESERSVTLFPFMAVLVCAMGSLILLLLVTTRRLQQQKTVQLTLLSLPVAPLPAPKILPLIVPEAGLFEVSRADAFAGSRGGTKPGGTGQFAPHNSTQQLSQGPAVPPAYLQQQHLDREWTMRVRELATVREEQAKRVTALQQQLAQQTAELDRLQAEEQQTGLAAQRQRTEEVAVHEELIRATLARTELSAAVDETEQLLRELLARKQQDKGQRFTILPVDPISGTTRRPIIIDCRSDQLLLVAEGITLRASDVEGFTPLYNPLAAAVLGLARERQEGPEENAEPYVLLIVRPEGMVSYYVARTLLQSHQVPFGYELFGPEEDFVWQPSSPAEIEACRRAIEAAQRHRPQGDGPVVSQLGVSQPIHVTGPRGEFHLPEIDNLKNPERTVSIAGQRFHRDSASSVAAGNHRSTQTPSSGGAPLPGGLLPAPPSSALPSRRELPSRVPASASETDLSRIDQLPGAKERFSRARPATSVNNNMKSRTLSDSSRSAESQPSVSPLNSPSQGSRDVPSTNSEGDAVTDAYRPRHWNSDDNRIAKPNTDRQNSGANQQSRPGFANGETNGSRGEADVARRWGMFTPGSSIGIKQDVAIRIEASRLTVGEQAPVSMQEVDLGDLQSTIASRLEAHVSAWGRPPEGFYWLPRVEFIVSPGGARDYESALSLMKAWGIDSSVKYVLN